MSYEADHFALYDCIKKATSSFGTPKMPDEIAGIETLLHLSSFALSRVLMTAAIKRFSQTLGEN